MKRLKADGTTDETNLYTLHFESVYEYLEGLELESGIIRINDDIEDGVARQLSRRISYAIMNEQPKLTLIITSPGGSIYHAFAAYDSIKLAETKGIEVTGIVEGFACSAASMILLQACKIRKAMSHARLHLHEPSQWAFMESKKTSQMEEDLAELNALTDMTLTLLSERTGKTKEELKSFITRRERWMSAQEAKTFGLIDEVLG